MLGQRAAVFVTVLEACHDVVSLVGKRLKQKTRIVVIACYCGNAYRNR